MSKKHQTDNIMNFPSEHMDNLRVLEALLFAASEPLDAESMKARLPKGSNLNKLLSLLKACLLYTSPSPRDLSTSRMPSSA